MIINITCTKSPNCYHGIEGFHINQMYKALEVYTPKGIYFMLYTELTHNHWIPAETVSTKTFKKFFKEAN